MKLYKNILDRANNSTKEENERFMKLLKKNADRKKKLLKSKKNQILTECAKGASYAINN